MIAIAVTMSILSYSQMAENLTYGLKAGANYSEIANIPELIVSEPYYQGYTLESNPKIMPTFGFFINYKFPYTRIALQPELNYSMEHSSVEYSDINDLQYTIDLKYNYLQVNSLVKFYPISGLNIGIGPQLGFSLNPSNLHYKSNQEELYGPDLTTQQILRDNIKGRTNFQLLFNLGYETNFGLFMDVRYALGLSDAVETHANSFNWIENENRIQNIQITIGYAFNFDSRETF